MKVGKCRMQYMHDTINGKIKASQGVEYINYGHNCCGASEPEASERSSSLIGVVCSQKVNF